MLYNGFAYLCLYPRRHGTFIAQATSCDLLDPEELVELILHTIIENNILLKSCLPCSFLMNHHFEVPSTSNRDL